MYEYGNIEDAKAGDVVEYHGKSKYWTVGNLYIVQPFESAAKDSIKAYTDSGSLDGIHKNCWKLVKTRPGETAGVGDTIMLVRQKYPKYYVLGKIGMVEIVTGKDGKDLINKTSPFGWKPYDCVVLCKATRPPNEDGNPFKVGDVVRRIAGNHAGCLLNSLHTVTRIYSQEVYYEQGYSSHYKNWELVTQPTEWVDRILPTEKRNLAFYKRSGKPWTREEYNNIQQYCGDCTDTSTTFSHKWVFDDKAPKSFMYTWSEQERHSNFKNCKQVAYEDIFKTTVTTSCSQHDDIADAISYITPIPEEETMNKSSLILLLEMMAAMSNEEVTDATNAQHIGILTEVNGSYVGYVYANTLAELEDVVRTPANEGRTLHVFDYSTTLAQKPRQVVAVART